MSPKPAPDAPTVTEQDEAKNQKEFEENLARSAKKQNLPEGSVPEQRPIANQERDSHSETFKKLQAQGSPLAGAPAMDKAAYDRAASAEQRKKAEKESLGRMRLFPGARAYIDNPDDKANNGRAVAVNRVESWKTPQDALLAASGTPEGNYAQPATYECMTRDGRAELMIINAEHLRVPAQQQDWGKTPIH